MYLYAVLVKLARWNHHHHHHHHHHHYHHHHAIIIIIIDMHNLAIENP